VAPALGFLDVYPFRYSFVADHFQYLASLAPIALVSAALMWIAGRATRAPAVAAEMVVAIVVAPPLLWLAWAQSRPDVAAATLYQSTLSRNPGCWLCLENLGVLSLNGTRGGFEKAAAYYREALTINPQEPQVHNNLGTSLAELGRVDEALAEHKLAV